MPSENLTHKKPRFIQDKTIAAAPPPLLQTKYWTFFRKNFLSSPVDVVFMTLVLVICFNFIPYFLEFTIFDAVWTGSTREACLLKEGKPLGACWPFIADRFHYMIYASYPLSERWRVNLFFILVVTSIFFLLHRSPRIDKNAAILYAFLIAPLASYTLLTGESVSSLLPTWLNSLILFFIAGKFFFTLKKSKDFFSKEFIQTIIAFIIIIFLEIAEITFDLPDVPTNMWGGFMVTLVVAMVSIAVSLPLGVFLALGRISRLPFVRYFSIAFIEFIRGVPIITILFMANVMLPLFLPEGSAPDKLFRALVGMSFFASAYMAEVIRAGLSALPNGQFEGALALGFSYTQRMRLIILPQALRIVIPNIVGIQVSMFKDTSLLLIIGIFDFMKTVETARVSPEWAVPTVAATGYIYTALVYFVICLSMSRYARGLELHLKTGRETR